jgi:Transglutaminase-like superfamily
MGQLCKFWSINKEEKRLFFEAFILLLLVQLSVKTVAFKHIYSLLRDRWSVDIRGASYRPDSVALVKLALSRAGSLLPWQSACLSRSIAAFIMLRRRGIPAVIFAGVRSEDTLLYAHAWVHAGPGVVDTGPGGDPYTAVIRIGQNSVDW